MVESKFTVAAETIIRDSETNSISIINLLEDISSPGFPILLPKLSIIWNLTRLQTDPEVYETELRIKINENILNQYPITIDFQGSLNTRSLALLNGFVVNAPGKLNIELFLGDTQLSKYSVDVELINQGIVASPI